MNAPYGEVRVDAPNTSLADMTDYSGSSRRILLGDKEQYEQKIRSNRMYPLKDRFADRADTRRCIQQIRNIRTWLLIKPE